MVSPFGGQNAVLTSKRRFTKRCYVWIDKKISFLRTEKIPLLKGVIGASFSQTKALNGALFSHPDPRSPIPDPARSKAIQRRVSAASTSGEHRALDCFTPAARSSDESPHQAPTARLIQSSGFFLHFSKVAYDFIPNGPKK